MVIRHFIPAAIFGILLAPAAARAQEEVVYYHTDAIGSVRAITSATGAVIARYDFLPFGELWPSVPPAPSEDRRFAGKERETIGEFDLDYFGARYYAGVIGRFTSVDPVLPIEDALVDPQRWNRYTYVMNRPLTLTDPDGRCPSCLMMLQRLATVASRYGTAAYNWATRFFNTPTGQEITQTAAETLTGASLPSYTLTGNVGRLAKSEFETGVRLAQRLRESLRVSDHVGAEFVSAAGKTYDAMGSARAYSNWNAKEFMESIASHLRKQNDFTVIDLTGASAAQIGAIRSYVGALQKELQSKIIFVGEYF